MSGWDITAIQAIFTCSWSRQGISLHRYFKKCYFSFSHMDISNNMLFWLWTFGHFWSLPPYGPFTALHLNNYKRTEFKTPRETTMVQITHLDQLMSVAAVSLRTFLYLTLNHMFLYSRLSSDGSWVKVGKTRMGERNSFLI